MKKTVMIISVTALVILGTNVWLHAADPADYDPTFNPPDGYVGVAMADSQTVLDVVTDFAGYIYVAMVTETSEGTTGFRPAVLVLTPEGDVDATFGTDGVYEVPVDLPASYTSSYVDIALANDGMIYLSFPGEGGTPSSWNFFLARILADGSGLDTSFGFLGLTVAAFDKVGADDHPGDDVPHDMVVQSDGKIVVIGEVERVGGTDYDFGVARFTVSGGNDTTFNSDGQSVVAFDLGGGYADYPWGVALTGSGEIIVVGNGQTATGFDLVVAALDSTGSLEMSFSHDGKASFQYEDLASGLTANDNRGFAVTTVPMVIEKRAKGLILDTIFIGGWSFDPVLFQGTKEMSVLCIDGEGDPCVGFGMQGWTLLDFSDGSFEGIGDTDDSVGNIFYDGDADSITVVGDATQVTGNQWSYNAVARISALNGALDTSFSGDGQRYFTEVGGYAHFISGCVDSSKRIIIATDQYSDSNSSENPWVARLGATVVDVPFFSDGFESGDVNQWSGSTP